uniref:HAT C-terminal dimerisation domain-containing protein n=1 Tax=Amphiprion ocellaris TaxID=80972 RepID=A0AAQ5X984_AMPOC
MLQSLIEQKRALGTFGSEYELPDNLIVTAHQWSLFEKTLSVLAPFNKLTRKMSSGDALASDVIPAVTVLMRLLSNETDEDHGIKTMKETLAAAVKRRLSDGETNPMYCIATLLDPRMSTGEADKQEDLGEPPVRKLRKVQASSSPDSLFGEIAGERESASPGLAPVGGAIQLETYLGETTTAQDENPLQYWGAHRVRFPILAQMSKRYLSAPCSSVDSERLFCSVSHIVDEKRNRLTAENAEKLLFIKKNLTKHIFNTDHLLLMNQQQHHNNK